MPLILVILKCLTWKIEANFLSLLCVQVTCSVHQAGMSQVRSCCAILLSLMAVVEPVCEGELMARMSWMLHHHLNRAVSTDLNTNQCNTCLSGCLKTALIGGLRLLSQGLRLAGTCSASVGWRMEKMGAATFSAWSRPQTLCGREVMNGIYLFGDIAQPAQYWYLMLQSCVVFCKKVFCGKNADRFSSYWLKIPLILKNYFVDLHISQTITRLLPFTGILCVNEDRLELHNRFPLKKALCGYFLLSGILVNCLVIINWWD